MKHKKTNKTNEAEQNADLFFILFRFSGKIDLKDVKNSASSAFESTTEYASNVYQWTLKQIKS